MTASRPRARLFRNLLWGSSLALLAQACEDDGATVITRPLDENPDDGTGTAGNAGSAGSNDPVGAAGSGGTTPQDNASAGASGSGGAPGSEPPAGGTIELAGEISTDTTWTADNTYVLTDLVFVVGGSTLTIEPGTRILGGGVGSALIVTRGSQLIAEGTADAPIVFTSNIAEGLRDPGDWGGVALLGSAAINVPNAQLEGIEAVGGRGAYGGTDDASSCGSLKYVRIEFAGFEFSTDNELNGLTLAACGSGTNIDFVQVHRGSDDGIEVFGGKVDLRHVVLSNIQDDSLDWDFGWTGRAQFLVVRQDADASDAGFEADNGNPSTDVSPRSEPSIYNATLIGSAGATSPGMVLRRGTWANIHNSIIQGFPLAGVDIRDAFSVDGAGLNPPRLTIENSIFFNNGPGGTQHGDADATDDDGGFDEDAFLRGRPAELANRFDVDPGLADADLVTNPNLVPPADGPAATGGATPPAGFDTAATFIGALPPGGPDWTVGWTSYPEN